MEPWSLIRTTSANTGGRGAQIAVLRGVSQAEYEEIKSAQRLIWSFGNDWGWNRIIQGFQTVNDEKDRCAAATEKASGAENSSDMESLRLAYMKCIKQMCNWVDEVHSCVEAPAEADESIWAAKIIYAEKFMSEDIGSALNKILSSDPTGLVRIMKGPSNSEVMILSRAALETAGIETSGDLLAIPLLLSALQKLEILAAHDLAAKEKLVKNAARRILGLYAESIYGSVNLVPSDQFTPERAKEGLQLKLDILDSSGIEPLVHAVENAVDIVRRLKAGPPPASADPLQSVAAQSAAEESPSVQPSPAETSAPAVTSLSHLLDHVERISDETEIAWSSAISSDANAEILANWNSFINGFKEVMEHRSERTSPSERIIPRFPLDPETLTGLIRSEEPDSSVTTLLTAELYSLKKLVETMQGLKEPNSRLDLVTGEENSWWSSGAFSLVRAAAREVVKVEQLIEETAPLLDADERETKDTASLNALSSPMESIFHAQNALENGLVEASLFYCVAVLRLLAQSLDENEIADYVSRITRSEPLGDAAKIAVQLNKYMTDGNEVEYAEIALLAYFWVPRMGQLIMAHFNTAARGEE